MDEMMEKIKDSDMKILGEIAGRYNLSVVEFCRVIIARSRKQNGRQFRVNEEEYDTLIARAKSSGLTLSRYCEAECRKFLSSAKIDRRFFEENVYGERRTKRISVTFLDRDLDEKLAKTAALYNCKVGTMLRYCLLDSKPGPR